MIIILVAAGAFWLMEERKSETPAEVHFGRVVTVHDGDTVTIIKKDGRKAKIRFFGLDAPEMNQPHGPAAKKFLAGLVGRGEVRAEVHDIDQYDRLVARLSVEGRPVDREMIGAGLAWVYERYCDRSFCGELRDLEATARENRQGLWSDPDPTPPWVWRRDNRRR